MASLLVILAAAGIPGAAVFGYITQHPWTALGILIFYEFILFLLSFVTKVWQRWEDRLADHTATSIGYRVQGIASRYRIRYRQYLCDQHRDFDVRGLSTQGPYGLELDQVFIELAIDTITLQEATANPIQLPRKLREGSHTIWDYLVATPLSKQHLVIIGPPGCGKTTIFKHIALTLASHRKVRHYIKVPHKLPILLFLRDHAASIKNRDHFTLVDAIHEHLRKWDQPMPPQNWFERRLARGRCIVMLDGLDEVADSEARKLVVNWVDRQVSLHSKNRFLITSRPFGYKSNPLRGVTVLQVQPFTTEQVEHFVQKWYLANEIMSKRKDDSGVRMRARADAKSLLQQLHTTPALFDLTANPLLLTMIATVHRFGGGGKLPNNRVTLYTEICQVFFGKRQEARGQVLELTPAQMQLVLEPLAYHLMVTEKREIELDEVCMVIEEPLSWVNTQMIPATFLQLVEQVSGLLLERENGVYSFAHLTFQEYLAASYLGEKQSGDKLITKVGESWWRETIRLYCAMADATSIIAACLEDDRPSVSALELAIDCDKEARKVQPEVRTKLEVLLVQGVEDPDPDRQHVIAGALLARRLNSMTHLKDQTYADTSLITCAEYQLFLDEQRAKNNYLQPDHWTSDHFPNGKGNAPLLGVRSSDAKAFCAWLTAREQGHWQYRLPKANELDSEGLSGRLPMGTGYWLQGEGFAWATKASTQPATSLNKVVKSMLAHDLASDSEIASDSEVAASINFAIDSVSNLASARARALDLARELARICDLERVIHLARTCASAPCIGYLMYPFFIKE